MDTQDVLAQFLAKADECLDEAEALESQAHDLVRQAEKMRVRHEAYLDAADLLRPVLVTDEDDLTRLVVDFTGCNSIVDRLVRIGRAAPNKFLNTTKTAQFLLDNGQSRSDLKNYRTEVNRALSTNPQLFTKVSAGTYRYCDVSTTLAEAINGVQEGEPEVTAVGLEGPTLSRYGLAEG